MKTPIITLADISYDYRSGDRSKTTALRGINLKLSAGERVAVFGPNGSGKSTLLRVMAGLARPTSGVLSIFGCETTPANLPQPLRRRIGFLCQNPEDVFATKTVADEIQFALQCHDPDSPVTDDTILAILQRNNLTHLAGRPLDSLSGGEKQIVALTSVLAAGPELIFFDEPTSSLDPPGRRDFLHHSVFTSNEARTTVVLVTQYWMEVLGFDRVLVLDEGGLIFDGPPSEYNPAEAPVPVEQIELDKQWLKRVALTTDASLVVENLNQTEPVFPGELICPLRNISFSIKPGERVGVLGPTGAGKSTLAYHLAGLMPKHSGTITIAGRTVANNTKKNERPPVALLMQNPDHNLFAETVTQDVAFGPQNLNFSAEEIAPHVKQSLVLADLPAEIFGERSPFEISGGEQRKAALAGTLALPAAVYIFDEPTVYLDLQSMNRVEALINALSAQGRMIIVISHDLLFLSRVCPRWIILQEGKLIYDGKHEELKQDSTPLQQIDFA